MSREGRAAIQLIEDDMTGDNRWYDIYSPLADEIYDRHLAAIEKEGLIEDA